MNVLIDFFFLIFTQTEEIKRLHEKLKEREEASKKNVDQMEELHENLAELDARFERSEEQNKVMKKEKEELARKTEDEAEENERNIVSHSLVSSLYDMHAPLVDSIIKNRL